MQFVPPGEIVEGVTQPNRGLLDELFNRREGREFPLDRLELDLQDPTNFSRQVYDQVRAGGMSCLHCLLPAVLIVAKWWWRVIASHPTHLKNLPLARLGSFIVPLARAPLLRLLYMCGCSIYKPA